jgi:hypothetical protein
MADIRRSDAATRPIIHPLNSLLISLFPSYPPSGLVTWRQAFWLYQPHAFLHGKTPAEVLSTIEALRRLFQPVDKNW